jgi:hypothetical protein
MLDYYGVICKNMVRINRTIDFNSSLDYREKLNDELDEEKE